MDIEIHIVQKLKTIKGLNIKNIRIKHSTSDPGINVIFCIIINNTFFPLGFYLNLMMFF